MDITKYAGNSRFLKAVDLGGREPRVTIKGVYEETMQDGTIKAVLEFAGKDKMLVLNATNVKTLIGLLGVREAAWAGQQIMLYSVDTGQYGLGIRIKGVVTGVARTPAAVAMQDFMAPLENKLQQSLAAQASSDEYDDTGFDDDIPF